MDIIGKRFGRLTVVSKSPRKGYVVCKCDCGNICEVQAYTLTKKVRPTVSCGCKRRETSSVNGKNSIHQNSAKRLEEVAKYGTNVWMISNLRPLRNNKSGHRGVSYSEERDVYISRISFQNKTYYLGSFHNINDAIEARREAEQRLFAPILSDIQQCSLNGT